MNYYYTAEDGESIGPCDELRLRQLFEQGAIHENSWIIEEGATEWITYGSLYQTGQACGSPSAALVNSCAHCGAQNEDDALFCGDCGAKLDGSLVSGNGKVRPGAQQGFRKHAFISHSSRDHQMAELVCGVLESHGVHCWIAPRDIDPGAPYDEEILRGIAACQTFIVLLSESSNESPHVKRELMCALRAEHAVYPIRIQDVQPGPKLEYLLEGIHWVDACAPPIEPHLDRLAHLIVSNDPTADEARRAAARKIVNKPLWRMQRGNRVVLTGIFVVLAMALLAAGWAAVTWKSEVISGIVSHLVQQVDALLPFGKPSGAEVENTKRDRHAALLAEAKAAVSNREWQAAVNAYEAALGLFDDAETRNALAEAANARDLQQVAERKRAEFSRLIADAEQAERNGDFSTAQTAYERAASAAPTDGERIQVQEKARKAGDGIAYQKKKAEFDELMLQAREAEGRKDWRGASEIYARAATTAPTESLAAQARARKNQIVAYLNDRATLGSQVIQTVTLTWARDRTAVKTNPSNSQICSASGDVIGDVVLAGKLAGAANLFGDCPTAVLNFREPKQKKEILLCEFAFDDPIGQIRVGNAEGISVTGQVREITKALIREKYVTIETITLQVTVKR